MSVFPQIELINNITLPHYSITIEQLYLLSHNYRLFSDIICISIFLQSSICNRGPMFNLHAPISAHKSEYAHLQKSKMIY